MARPPIDIKKSIDEVKDKLTERGLALRGDE